MYLWLSTCNLSLSGSAQLMLQWSNLWHQHLLVHAALVPVIEKLVAGLGYNLTDPASATELL